MAITDNEMHGLVTTRFGNRAEIEDKNGNAYICHIRRALQGLVIGDHVLWHLDEAAKEPDRGVITKILPRETVLERPIRYQGVKPVAANIDQIFVTTAIEPHFSRRILDRYLVAIEQTGIDAFIILNKVDLLPEDSKIYSIMMTYEELGYEVINLSAKQNIGTESLLERLKSHCSIFVGQSGVGKSSLVNRILPESDIRVAKLSDTSGLGTHTTTNSRLYHLPNGGIIIDSPGIRDFGMDHLEPDMIAHGFREFQHLAEHCKFRDCQHMNEPQCSVKEAVQSGHIDPRRYESYEILYAEAKGTDN
ncbi:MAG: small ribosomal subunit biogenesis GTPase RsgA [Enterobacterales bacterium]|nr:small ribosomal subunit biogenesis GTPase RsgA [Enterobacterales bacterium]